MIRVVPLLVVLVLAASCASSSQSSVETVPADPATRVSTASDQLEERGTIRFRMVDDQQPESSVLEGSYSSSGGVYYTFGLDELVGAGSPTGDLRTEILITERGMFVHSDLFLMTGDLAGERDPGLWVEAPTEFGSDDLLRFFSLLAGGLSDVAGDATTTVSEAGADELGIRLVVEWPNPKDRIDAIESVDVWIDESENIVRASIQQDSTTWVIELSDHGEPVEIPVPERVVAFDALGETIANPGNDLPQERPITDDISQVLATHLPTGWTVGTATERIDTVDGPTGLGLTISDYTLVWLPDDLAGTSREDANESQRTEFDYPTLFVNVGSRYYEDIYWPALGADPTTGVEPYGAGTPVDDDSGLMHLTFRVGCCVVTLRARGLEESDVRLVAAGLIDTDHDAWRAELGDRLPGERRIRVAHGAGQRAVPSLMSRPIRRDVMATFHHRLRKLGFALVLAAIVSGCGSTGEPINGESILQVPVSGTAAASTSTSGDTVTRLLDVTGNCPQALVDSVS